jgi:hypothetical protein
MKPRALRDEALSIHGDSLLAEGRAQGTLINLQLARHRSPFSRRANAMKQSEQQLIAEHRDELLGPLAALPGTEASFAFGFISNLHVTLREEDDLELLVEALAEPSFARLERLTLRGPVVDLSCLRDVGLVQLTLVDTPDWEPVFETLPPIRSLALLDGPELACDGLSLPATEVLRVDGAISDLQLLRAPKLRVLAVSELPEAAEVPKLELLYVEGDLFGDVDGLRARRVIQEWEYGGDDDGRVGVISRNGRGRIGERAFLLTNGTVDDARALLDGKNVTIATARLEFGCQAWAALELRMEGAADGTVLRQLSQTFARRGQRTLEFAVSPSNLECIAWSIEPERVRPLAMGPAKDRDGLWRLAIDRALAIDPGDVLDELLLELDGNEPVVAGEPPVEGTEWPLVTTFTPRTPDWDWDYDMDLDEDAVEAEPTFDPTDFRDQSGPRNWWKPAEEEAPMVDEAAFVAPAVEPEAAEEEDDGEREASGDEREDWGDVLAESPIELESDGEERNPEFGLEPDSFDPDSVEAADEHECEVCEARAALRPCFSCGRRVCPACIVGAPRASGEVKCSACPSPRPSARPEPQPDFSDETEEEEEA